MPVAVIDGIGAVASIVSDGVAVVDGGSVVRLFNPAASKMTGWSVGDAVGADFHTIFKFFDITERPIVEDQNPIIRAMRSGRTIQQDDLFLQTSSQKYIHVAVTATPISQPVKQKKAGLLSMLNKPIGEDDESSKLPTGSSVVITFRDVSAERSESNSQSDFISTASHEMRTPIAIIEGYISMLLNPATATIDSRAQVYAQKAHVAAEHLGRLFQDLLDVTKIDDNRLRSYPILVDAGAATRQVVGNWQFQAKEKNLELKMETLGEVQPLYIIYVDLNQFQEVLDNFIGNAIKYTSQGTVTVSVKENEGKVRISVQDTGIGIPAEDVPHLFQKFYRIDNSSTREIGGTGLGLYLTKHLAEHLGGQVGVDSDYGRGSTFWVEFDILTRDQAIVKAREIKQRDAAMAARAAQQKQPNKEG